MVCLDGIFSRVTCHKDTVTRVWSVNGGEGEHTYIYIYMYVCMWYVRVCMYVCMYLHMHSCMCVFTCVYVHVHIYLTFEIQIFYACFNLCSKLSYTWHIHVHSLLVSYLFMCLSESTYVKFNMIAQSRCAAFMVPVVCRFKQPLLVTTHGGIENANRFELRLWWYGWLLIKGL